MNDTDQQAVLTLTVQAESVLCGTYYVFSPKRRSVCANDETVSTRG